MAKISPYVSGKLKELKVGITSFSENKTSLQVTGNIGVGTTNPHASVSAANTSVLAVGILTANKIFSTGFGQFTGGGIAVDNIVGTALSISGISTLANVKIASGNVAIGTDDATAQVSASNTSILAVGILTANKIFSTGFGQFTGGSVIADNIVGVGLSISGISTLGKDFVVTPTSSGVGATVGGKTGVVTYFGDGSQLTGIDATGNLTPTNLLVSGITTLGVTSATDLTAEDLFVTGIATFGTSSIVINGNNELINVGTALTLGNVEGVLTPSIVVSGVSTLGVTTATDLTVVNLDVSGISSVGSAITMYGATGIISATRVFANGTELSPTVTGVNTGVGTFIASAGVSTNIDSFAYASLDYKLAEYSLHFMNGSNIQAERIIVMQDNTTAYSNEFAIMSSSDLLISVGATISGSNVVIQATPETGVSGLTTYRWRREVQE
ncbi:MAG: hypothetical protein CMO97_01725 [Woeseia sp.]|nr:hypothetical protein [Woeseia sp.]|tara:strand:- start:16221 stop:17546 length:1326 start_codon:yes stop_codon:yes gene_type:complete